MATFPAKVAEHNDFYAHLLQRRMVVASQAARYKALYDGLLCEMEWLNHDLMALLVRIPEDPDEETLPKLLEDARFVAACEFAATFGQGDQLCADERVLDMPF